MDQEQNPLKDLFWRDEILQIMYWFQGEGFGQEVTATDLRRFLAADAPPIEPYLEAMAAEGWLARSAPDVFYLTPMGRAEGARRFADAFESLTRPAHGECSDDCDCHRTGDPASCTNRQHDHAHAH